MLNGMLVDLFGQKRVILGALFCLSGLVFITFFAPNISVLTAGEILCGLPWGIFATSAPAYASEVLPLSLRVYMTSYTNMCFIIGQLIAAGVLAGLVGWDSEWAYRIPFALQWMWPVILIPVLVFAPESPWHLVRKGRIEDAEKSLRRLQSKSANIDIKDTLATIVHTNQLEVQLAAGTSYWDCFRGTELRRTEIACMAFAGQIFTGLNFAYNSTYFFQQVGLSTNATYKLNTGGTAMALVGTFVNWLVLMPYLGRRTIYVWGSFFMALILFIIGILNPWTSHHSVALTQAILTLIWTFAFQLSVGQLGWGLPAEMGSTRLRQKTVCLARNAYYITSVVGGVLQPYFMNPAAWNVKGYVGFFWGGLAFLTFIWAFFRLPETKGRTFEEIDWLFAKHTPTRKFSTTQVDIFDQDERKRL
jgi:SP family general alpha glucoside:H+ symporter-like MFS transporter